MTANHGCRPVEDLLPGILDHIVFNKIVPKLQWKDFYVLSSVSRAWYNAIRSRRVFNSRVLSHSSETLVPVYYTHNTIALYSMRENSWHKLPPIANPRGGDGIPASAQCISMDGKIYLLGGMMDSEVSRKVFVFDLARQGHWKQCTSMKYRRLDFGSAVIDGKIYVFGGKAPDIVHSSIYARVYGPRLKLISNSEVYDPKEDTWSHITPMTTCRFGQHVTPIGEELFIYGGWTQYIGSSGLCIPGDSFEAYHPFKDEWRVVQRSWNQPERGVFFTAQGNVFSIQADCAHGDLGLNSLAIHKYDIHGNSWINVHSFSFAELIPIEYDSVRTCAKPDAILAVADELIALVGCREKKSKRTWGLCLFQSTGFSSENQKISWKLRAITFGQERLQLREHTTFCLVGMLPEELLQLLSDMQGQTAKRDKGAQQQLAKTFPDFEIVWCGGFDSRN